MSKYRAICYYSGYSEGYGDTKEEAIAMCGGCGSRSPMILEEAKERAIEAWNRRAENDD